MSDPNPIHALADALPQPLRGVLELGAGFAADATRLPTALGDDLDQWDPAYIQRTLPVVRAAVGGYFRSEVRGLENIPAEGPSLLVGNHSGGLLIADTFAFTVCFYDRFGPQRRFHQLAHDLAARSPLLGGIRRYGTLAASHRNARAAFRAGAPVLVYPGGDYETFRPSWEGDRIQFAGRRGFVHLALEEGVPIVPVVSAGGQETALFLTRGRGLARALRLDRLRLKVLPISIGPPLGINVLDLPGRLPLPAKITVQVLPPIDLDQRFGPAPDPDRVYESVTAEMQQTLTDLSEERTAPVLG
jgi:1-acyl-sn-glycerol-3-phosphate acyltransferase